MFAPKPAAYTTTHPAAAVLVVITNQNKKNSKSKNLKFSDKNEEAKRSVNRA